MYRQAIIILKGSVIGTPASTEACSFQGQLKTSRGSSESLRGHVCLPLTSVGLRMTKNEKKPVKQECSYVLKKHSECQGSSIWLLSALECVLKAYKCHFQFCWKKWLFSFLQSFKGLWRLLWASENPPEVKGTQLISWLEVPSGTFPCRFRTHRYFFL